MSEPIVVNRKLIKMINLLDYEKKNRAWNGTSLAVQWLRLCAPEAGGTGLIPGWGANIPQDRAKHRREEKNKQTNKLRRWSLLAFYADVLPPQVALVVKNPPVIARNLRDAGSILGSGRCPGGGNGTPLYYSCLENPMDRGSWLATVCRVVKSRTRWSDLAWSGVQTRRPEPGGDKAALMP